ncbi:MAG TPA: peptide-methionine (S)-S-oxide reductase MsrA [Gemmatimonadales bacterium]|nr:peptide-methionine (S)-S-oxide reductase MsrA [Gemmatimonadales bacterium]
MTTTATATLGGGCFWCLEAVFERLAGVSAVTSGYAGGARPHPTYEQVCSGATGHAEVIRVVYDPEVVRYEELLEVFFAFHDPTTLNRQGPDRGTQYRSIILAETEAQEAAARATIAQLEADGTFEDPIVTEVRRLDTFWPAEPGHAGYYRRNPDQAYCRAIIAPKVARLRQRYADRLAP